MVRTRKIAFAVSGTITGCGSGGTGCGSGGTGDDSATRHRLAVALREGVNGV
jgi:hypothetical protein